MLALIISMLRMAWMNTEPEAPAFLGQPNYLQQSWDTVEIKATEMNKRKLLKNVDKKAEVDVIPLANTWTYLEGMFSESWKYKGWASKSSWNLAVFLGAYCWIARALITVLVLAALLGNWRCAPFSMGWQWTPGGQIHIFINPSLSFFFFFFLLSGHPAFKIWVLILWD